jgi:hypothetical protein
MGPDSVVTEVFDMGARAEFFDWLSTEIAHESPRFAFSLTKTFRDLFGMLSEIIKDPFRSYVGKLVSAAPGSAVKEPAKRVPIAQAAAPAPAAAAVVSKSAAPVSKATAAPVVDDDDMPSLESFSRTPVAAPAAAPARASPAPAAAVAAVPSSSSQGALRGQAIFAALSLGRNDKLEEIVRSVNAWPAETVEGFVAAYQLLHK